MAKAKRRTTRTRRRKTTRKRTTTYSSLGIKLHHALRHTCKWCKLTGKGHNEDKHRFHGRCSFRNTHKGYCKKRKCGCQKE